jgi:hypothetical protein
MFELGSYEIKDDELNGKLKLKMSKRIWQIFRIFGHSLTVWQGLEESVKGFF